MIRYILDTTAFSAAMQRDRDLFWLFRSNQPGNFYTAPPVMAEIEYGIRRLESGSKKQRLLKSEKERLEMLIGVLPWDTESSVNFGAIKSELETRGELIDDFDIAIAAISLSHHCTLLTANQKHFDRITELQSTHWSDV